MSSTFSVTHLKEATRTYARTYDPHRPTDSAEEPNIP